MNLSKYERRLTKLARNSGEDKVAKRLAGLAAQYENKSVEYTTSYLGRTLTPKQREILESLEKPPHKVLARSANNQGKCVHPEDRIPLADGTMVQAKELVGKWFRVLTLVDGKCESVEAYANWDSPRPCCQIELESGEVLRRTANHPVWAAYRTNRKTGKGKWVECGKLTKKHVVAMPKTREHEGQEVLSDAEVKLVAYLLAKGGRDSSYLYYSNSKSPRELNDFKDSASLVGFSVSQYPSRVNTFNLTKGENPLSPKEFGTKYGFWCVGCDRRRIPTQLFSASKRQQALFLSRLYASDGYIFRSKTSLLVEVGYVSASEGMCRDVQELLNRFGIRSNVSRRNKNDWACRVLSTRDVKAFRDRIGVFGLENELAEACAQVEKRVQDKNQWREREAPEGCRWERIGKISQCEEVSTVAISVPKYHTFLTCIWEHNTFVSAIKASHHFDTRIPSETIVTAPTAKQVEDLLFKEIRALRPGDPCLAPKAARLQSRADHFVTGLTTIKPDAFQGRHPRYLGLIFDEATSIEPDFWRRSGTMFKPGGEHFWLAGFNPNDTSSYAFQEEQTGLWTVVEISALEHPNVLAGLKSDPIPFPNAITLETILDRINRECEETTNPDPAIDFQFGESGGSPVWWHPLSPEFEAQVLGRWPVLPTSSLLSPLLVDKCFENHQSILSTWPIAVGCDVARFGDDKTAIAVRVGRSLLRLELHSGRDTTWIAERLRQVILETLSALGRDASSARKVPVYIDSTGGYGAGVEDQHDGFNFIGVNNSSRSPDPKYPNMRTYLHCCLALYAENSGLDLSRLPLSERTAVRAELTAARYRLDGQGRRTIDPKSTIKKQLGRSPDRADAISLAYYIDPTSNLAL